MSQGDHLLASGRNIVNEGSNRGVVARLLGGVAIWARSSHRTRTELERPYGDVDVASQGSNMKAITALFETLGYVPEKRFNAIHGERRLIFNSSGDGHRVDVFLDRFEMCHSLTFGNRLVVEPLTIPAADLLLTKLQIAQINRKDLLDVYMLVLNHTLADSDGPANINANRLVEICDSDWGWFTTASDNLNHAKRMAADILEDGESQQVVIRRLDEILSAISHAPKTLTWKLRAKVGRRMRWYETPEDIA